MAFIQSTVGTAAALCVMGSYLLFNSLFSGIYFGVFPIWIDRWLVHVVFGYIAVVEVEFGVNTILGEFLR
jgi:hypothetical protein